MAAAAAMAAARAAADIRPARARCTRPSARPAARRRKCRSSRAATSRSIAASALPSAARRGRDTARTRRGPQTCYARDRGRRPTPAPVHFLPQQPGRPTPDRGLNDEEAAMARTAAQMVADAKGRVENLSVDQVAQERAQGSPVLVDIREPEERARLGVIPGSVAAPRGMLEFWADPTSSYHRPE